MEKKKHPIIHALIRGYRYSPGLSLFICAQTIVSAVVPTLQVLVVARFVDSVAATVSKGESAVHAGIWAAYVVLLVAYQWLAGTAMSLVWTRFENRIRQSLNVEIVTKRAELQYQYLENSDTWNMIKRVSDRPEAQFRKFYEVFFNSLCLLFKIIGIMGIIFVYQWWTALLMVVISVPLFKLSLASGRATYDVNKAVTEYNRKCDYYSGVITGRDAVQERSLFGYTGHMNALWEEKYAQYGKITNAAHRKWFAKLEGGSIIAALILAVNIMLLIFPAVKGTITIGLFISLVNACLSLIEAMSWELREYIDEFANKAEYFRELQLFFSLESVKGVLEKAQKSQGFESLEFRNVTFHYPGTSREILRNLSFKIEKGVHYAIVGRNGEGKTTIMKLLTGLYGDYEGSILINGRELREYEAAEIKGFFSALFQDYAKYEISIQDNLRLARADAGEEEICDALKKFGLLQKVEGLEKGVHSHLGKIHGDGTDFSGGEWQKLAISRTYMNDAPIYLLDEPTASLDPISECHVYQDFQVASRDKTTILISHRLGSVRLADVIFVLENGDIKEAGSHDRLMRAGGIYKEMYSSQESWYN